jgi:polar amino acid transport system substrate-binding protein
MLDLAAGRISAVVVDELVAIAIANENPGYKAVPFKYQSTGDAVTEQFGVAVPKGNEDLVEVVSGVVSGLLEDGKIDEFFAMYEE